MITKKVSNQMYCNLSHNTCVTCNR